MCFGNRLIRITYINPLSTQTKNSQDLNLLNEKNYQLLRTSVPLPPFMSGKHEEVS